MAGESCSTTSYNLLLNFGFGISPMTTSFPPPSSADFFGSLSFKISDHLSQCKDLLDPLGIELNVLLLEGLVARRSNFLSSCFQVRF